MRNIKSYFADRNIRKHPLLISALGSLFYLITSMHGFSFLGRSEAKQIPNKTRGVKESGLFALGTGVVSQINGKKEITRKDVADGITEKKNNGVKTQIPEKTGKAAAPKPVKKPQAPKIPTEKKPVAAAGNANIYLPMEPEDLTVVGFHQAGSGAIALDPKFNYPHRKNVTMALRGRGTDPRSAVDVGAPAGTPVTSPVDGVVTGIDVYNLYGKLQDYRVTIRPSEDKNVSLRVLHVQKPQVSVGQKVYAKGTPLAEVRDLDSTFRSQIAGISSDGSGDHVHMEARQL